MVPMTFNQIFAISSSFRPPRGRRVRREDTPLRGVDTPLRGLCDFSEHTPLRGV